MPYDNRQRRDAARSTRARITEAAKASFLDHGFGGTTIRRVAEDAEVSQETIYKAFGGKAALLKAVYDIALVGDDDDIPLADRPEAIAVREATSPVAAAASYAELAGSISRRIDPLLRVLLGSRDTDPALGEFARTIEGERRAGSTFYVRHWESSGWLRDDVSVEHAIDAVWALNSPQPRWLLLDHGWSEEQFTEWLSGQIRHAIFAPET